LIDINHKAPATAQASFNLIRCIMAAVATGVVEYMIDGIGFGLSFTIFGALAALSTLLYYVELKQGMTWRLARCEKIADQAILPRQEETILVRNQEK
jgi:uncharacterized membrane protein